MDDQINDLVGVASGRSIAVKIHEATCAGDSSGSVFKGREIDKTTAIVRRRAGLDVVICGQDVGMNRQTALEVEQSVGPWMRQQSHTRSAGPRSLPHFQQRSPPPVGHCFYETANKKARK